MAGPSKRIRLFSLETQPFLPFAPLCRHHDGPLRCYASLVSTPADPVEPVYPQLHGLRRHPQRRMLPHNETVRIYRRSLIKAEDIAPSPHRSRFPLREIGRERLYLRIAQLDPFTYGKDRLVWESYTGKVFAAYRSQVWDIEQGWVKQHATTRAAARRKLQQLMDGDEALVPYPGLWDWDLIEWKLHRAHSNAKEWDRRLKGQTDAEMGRAQQEGKERAARKRYKRVFLSDEELIEKLKGLGVSVDEAIEQNETIKKRRVENEAAGVKLKTGRPKKGEVRPTLENWMQGRLASMEVVKVKRRRGRQKQNEEVSKIES